MQPDTHVWHAQLEPDSQRSKRKVWKIVQAEVSLVAPRNKAAVIGVEQSRQLGLGMSLGANWPLARAAFMPSHVCTGRRGSDRSSPGGNRVSLQVHELAASAGKETQHLTTMHGNYCCARIRWHNQLNPDVRKEPFSDWEDAVIVQVGCFTQCTVG
jgi:hypothetical protein